MTSETGGHEQIEGDELPTGLAEVSTDDLAYLADLRKNGGRGTKKKLEAFGKEKLGFDVNCSYSVDNILNKFLLPKLRARLSENGVTAETTKSTKEVVTMDNFKDEDAPLADEMSTSGVSATVSNEPIQAESDLETASKEALIAEIMRLRRLAKGIETVPTNVTPKVEYLKNTNTGNVTAWTKVLAGLKHMYPCNKQGRLLNSM